MISRGGVKVAPAMVEDAIRSHPDVATAAVVGASDEREGQVPVSFFRVDHWPLTAQGKLDRARLVWMADFGDGREL